jgi:hypothetical protein
MNDLQVEAKIEGMIYLIRGLRVMLDSDLAELYGVETKALNQSVKRNIDRFPEDFMFECNSSDLKGLRSQFVTANSSSVWNYKRRTSPMVFTENGVAMLSSVLNSKRAISVNISIMRIFTKLRSFLFMERDIQDRMNRMEANTNYLFKVVFERLDDHESLITKHKTIDPDRRKIKLK